MNEIKVSIVTVCFNSAKTIEQTIQSVIHQTYGNIEYIIIDGGSTDGTDEIIKKYEKNIACWVSESDRGIYDAMNKGIAKATGDVIAFMNSDDWYADGAIDAIVKAFDRTDADIVYGHTILIDDGRQTLRVRPPLDHILYGMVFCHQAVVVKTNLMKEYLFDLSYKIVADYVFFLKMYLQGKRFYAIDKKIAYFRMGGDSSHPWKVFQETKRAALRLSKESIGEERYRNLRREFQERRFFPVLRFLFPKIQRQAMKNKKIFRSLENRKLVLYGAGKLGREVLDMMQKCGLHVSAFWDSDLGKQGMHTDGIPTLCPKQKKQQSHGVTILITTVKADEELLRKLEALGYEQGKDFFGREDWLRWMAGTWIGRRVQLHGIL